MLLLGASGLFVELQDALNTVWGVSSNTGQGIRGFIRHRLFSFAMVLGIGFLLLVSLVITAVLSAMGEWMSSALPGGAAIWQIVNIVVSLAVTAGLFAMILKLVPDVKITWRDVVVGSVATAVLFTLGKFAIGMYLGRSAAGSVFGAAGSLAILFIWVYYSAQIVLFGAEFTQVWANRYGSKLEGRMAPKRQSATATDPVLTGSAATVDFDQMRAASAAGTRREPQKQPSAEAPRVPTHRTG